MGAKLQVISTTALIAGSGRRHRLVCNCRASAETGRLDDTNWARFPLVTDTVSLFASCESEMCLLHMT